MIPRRTMKFRQTLLALCLLSTLSAHADDKPRLASLDELRDAVHAVMDQYIERGQLTGSNGPLVIKSPIYPNGEGNVEGIDSHQQELNNLISPHLNTLAYIYQVRKTERKRSEGRAILKNARYLGLFPQGVHLAGPSPVDFANSARLKARAEILKALNKPDTKNNQNINQLLAPNFPETQKLIAEMDAKLNRKTRDDFRKNVLRWFMWKKLTLLWNDAVSFSVQFEEKLLTTFGYFIPDFQVIQSPALEATMDLDPHGALISFLTQFHSIQKDGSLSAFWGKPVPKALLQIPESPYSDPFFEPLREIIKAALDEEQKWESLRFVVNRQGLTTDTLMELNAASKEVGTSDEIDPLIMMLPQGVEPESSLAFVQENAEINLQTLSSAVDARAWSLRPQAKNTAADIILNVGGLTLGDFETSGRIENQKFILDEPMDLFGTAIPSHDREFFDTAYGLFSSLMRIQVPGFSEFEKDKVIQLVRVLKGADFKSFEDIYRFKQEDVKTVPALAKAESLLMRAAIKTAIEYYRAQDPTLANSNEVKELQKYSDKEAIKYPGHWITSGEPIKSMASDLESYLRIHWDDPECTLTVCLSAGNLFRRATPLLLDLYFTLDRNRNGTLDDDDRAKLSALRAMVTY